MRERVPRRDAAGDEASAPCARGRSVNGSAACPERQADVDRLDRGTPTPRRRRRSRTTREPGTGRARAGRPRRRRPPTKYVGWSRRFLPTAGPPMPDRSRIAGVSMRAGGEHDDGRLDREVDLAPVGSPDPRRYARRAPVAHEHAVDGAVARPLAHRVVGVLEVRRERRPLAPLLAAGVAVAAERRDRRRPRRSAAASPSVSPRASSASAISSLTRFGIVRSVLDLDPRRRRRRDGRRTPARRAPSSPSAAHACADRGGRAQADHRVDHRPAAERRPGEEPDRAGLPTRRGRRGGTSRRRRPPRAGGSPARCDTPRARGRRRRGRPPAARPRSPLPRRPSRPPPRQRSAAPSGPCSSSTRIVFGACSADGGDVTGPGKPSAGQLGLRPWASGRP